MQLTKENTLKDEKLVDWEVYADQYDLLLTYNPFYQDLRKKVLAEVVRWELPPASLIADFGAGTGNFSIPTALHHSHTQVLHIDNNPGMNAKATVKARKKSLDNFQVISSEVGTLNFEKRVPGCNYLCSCPLCFSFSTESHGRHVYMAEARRKGSACQFR